MIPLVDLRAQYATIRGEVDSAIREVMDDCRFYQGPHVAKFEKAFAEYLGADHCIGVGSCTDALYLALKALRVGPGDEVIVPAMTFIATAEAVTMAGAMPIFVDIEQETGNIDPRLAEQAITAKTRAIIPVHLAGRACDMYALAEIGYRHGIPIVEDCAQAAGAKWDGRAVGTFGTFGCFSFYPSKNLGAYGDGGAVVTADPHFAKRVRMLADHGREHKFDHEFPGVCSRLDGLQAAVLAAKLRHLDVWNELRNLKARRYSELLKGLDGVTLPAIPDAPEEHVFHCYVALVKNRDDVRDRMLHRGVEAGLHYPVAVPLTKAYAHLGHKPWDFPEAHKFSQECLTLPLYPEISDDDMRYVAKALSEAVGA